MLFADVSLAARIERAEARLVSDTSTNVARRLDSDAVFVTPIAGGVAAFTEPSSPLNKVAGLGFGGAVDERELDALEQAYAERRCAVHVEFATLGDPSILTMLTRRGYALLGFENVLGRPLADVDLSPAFDGIEITSEDADFDTWLEVVVTGFATPDTQGVPSHESYPRDAIERVIRDFASTEGVTRYLARRDQVPAGGASMRTLEGVAQLCGAATLPAHRRRGVQSALLATRLAESRRAGCDIAVITTQPGSKSQQNAQARGFELLYSRAVLQRDG